MHLFVTLVKTVLTATLCHKCHRGRFLAFLVEQTGDLQSLSIVFLNYLFLPLAHRSESMSCRTLWSEHGKSPVKRTCKSPLIKRNCPGFKTSSKAKQLSKQSETFGRHVGCCSFYTTLGENSSTITGLSGIKCSWKRLGMVQLVQKEKSFTEDLVQISKSKLGLVPCYRVAGSMEGHCERTEGERLLRVAEPMQTGQKFDNDTPGFNAMMPTLGRANIIRNLWLPTELLLRCRPMPLRI